MDTKKFWTGTVKRNYVITREYGDIPGILKACDIHLNVPLSVMQAAIEKRTDEYIRLQNTLSHDVFMNHPIHRQDYGPSVIGNPSKPYRKDW